MTPHSHVLIVLSLVHILRCQYTGQSYPSVPSGLPSDLVTLDLSDNNITAVSGAEFMHFTALTTLVFTNNLIANFPDISTTNLQRKFSLDTLTK